MASDSENMDISKEDIDMDDENEDDDFDDETSSDSEEEQINDDQEETELMNLREIVKTNPYNYQNHLNYIGLAQRYSNLEHLRYSRQTMSEIFPLTEKLWLDWLQDEQKLLLSTVEKKPGLIELFEHAINDYLSVLIWVEYVQYRISLDLSSNAIEQLRNLFERSLSFCAVHLTNGALLWAAYIEVEQAKLMALVSNYNQNPNDDLKEKLLQQVDYILKLYRRQLSIPLRGMKTVYDEYNEFCQLYKEYLPLHYTDQFDLALKVDFDKAVQHLEQCERFEQELEDNNRNLATYRRYINFEKESARIQCLYERAIVDNCLDGDLWLSYLDFLEEELPSSTLLQSTFERSLRNCPWVPSLWVRYAEFMELNKLADHSQLKGIYDRALNADPTNLISFVNLQLAYLQYRRRHYEEQLELNNSEQLELFKEEIRHACEYACDQYQEFFLSSNDPKLFLKYNGQLELFWIHFEVKYFHSIEHARQIWNGRTLMNKSHNQMISNLWKNYYYMEISYGDNKHARRVLYRALNHIATIDYPIVICDLLLDHENKYGTIYQLKEAKDKLRQVTIKLKPVEKPKKQVQSKSMPQAKKPSTKVKQKENNEKQTKIPKQKMELVSKTVQANGKSRDQEQSQVSPRKRKLSPEETETVKKKSTTSIVDSEGFKIPLPPPPSISSSTNTKSVKIVPPTEIDHLQTVFLANLPYDVKEDEIRTAFASAGSIQDIRIVKHEWSGKSKGFGYADFATAEGYRQALKLDNTIINGRPVYVSPYDPNRTASDDVTKKFKYATALEQNKLFVSNLPFAAKKEDIENLFKQQGFNPKDVRLVTFKSGKPKGLAYVEFTDGNEASQAVLKVDKCEMDGHTIQVAISNPPKRQETSKLPEASKSSLNKATSLGEAPKSVGPRGKGFSQIALVPRKVTTARNLTPQSESTTVTTNKMTNDEFRKMLLNKK